MTSKQLSIIGAALKLFAEEGFDAVSTSKIAKSAGVSEGLIFKHFTNKKGLLDSIITYGMEMLSTYFEEIVRETDPKKAITQLIELPFNIKEEEHDFWRLLYALKWQRKTYDTTVTDNIKLLAEQSFTELGSKHPKVEANILLITLDGLATSILLKEDMEGKHQIIASIKQKFNL